MKLSLLTYFFSFILAGNCFSQQLQSKVITEIKPKVTTTKISEDHSITCILINSDSIYCYRGIDLQKGFYYSITNKNTYRAHIKQLKITSGNDLLFIHKPTITCPAKTIVDILDEMKINGIKNYALVKMNQTEESYFSTESIKLAPPEPIEITTPATVSKNKFSNHVPYILFTLTDKKTLFYELKTADTALIKTELIPFTVDKIYQTLNKIESNFKISLKQLNIMVYGHSDSRYPEFEKLINALKKKQLYKYNLVTIETP